MVYVQGGTLKHFLKKQNPKTIQTNVRLQGNGYLSYWGKYSMEKSRVFKKNSLGKVTEGFPFHCIPFLIAEFFLSHVWHFLK